jgi:hypothetical protein
MRRGAGDVTANYPAQTEESTDGQRNLSCRLVWFHPARAWEVGWPVTGGIFVEHQDGFVSSFFLFI